MEHIRIEESSCHGCCTFLVLAEERGAGGVEGRDAGKGLEELCVRGRLYAIFQVGSLSPLLLIDRILCPAEGGHMAEEGKRIIREVGFGVDAREYCIVMPQRPQRVSCHVPDLFVAEELQELVKLREDLFRSHIRGTDDELIGIEKGAAAGGCLPHALTPEGPPAEVVTELCIVEGAIGRTVDLPPAMVREGALLRIVLRKHDLLLEDLRAVLVPACLLLEGTEIPERLCERCGAPFLWLVSAIAVIVAAAIRCSIAAVAAIGRP